MALNTTDLGLIAVQKMLDALRSGKMKSLTEYTRNFRAEPFVMLDSECVFMDEMSDVMQSLQSQYAGYYLLAMAQLTTISNVQVASHMNKLNPSRSAVDAAANSASALAGLYVAAESGIGGLRSKDSENPEISSITGGVTRDSTKEIRELSNLSVGKVFTCEIADGANKLSIPMSIRLIANSLPAELLVATLTGDEVDKTLSERYFAWKSGRLSIMDMLFCNDLVKSHYKNQINDKDGIFRAITQRRRSNSLAAMVSGQPSIGTYSNMAVLTENSAKQLEIAMSGKSLKDFKAREALFDVTALMILAVVDRNWKRVTFYHQGIARQTEVSFRDLKQSNSGSGPDVAEILSAYKLGSSPVL